ncbi:MAG: 6-carboxytetrahydropterin synthase [Planctomycetota bacterium]
MRYRVCKSFEVETGHMLSKHPGRCRFPHGHSRRIDIVISAETLDGMDMVCDFKALKLAVADYIDSYDHAMAINAADPSVETLRTASRTNGSPELDADGARDDENRLIILEGEDPTTEVLARRIFQHVSSVVAGGGSFTDDRGNIFTLRTGLTLERVRVTETSSSWAEYGVDAPHA